MAEMKESWASLASFLGILAFCQTLLQVVFPPELRLASLKFLNRALGCCSSYCYFDIAEMDGHNTNEDIDCLANLSDRSKAPQGPAMPQSFSDPGTPGPASGGKDVNNNTITLSGLLNFTDGLWSCCGGVAGGGCAFSD